MRSIKYKVWMPEQKKMYGPFGLRDLFNNYDGGFPYNDCEGLPDADNTEEWEKSIWLQFTGLLDWYEGDLFIINGFRRVVIFDEGCFWFETIKSENRVLCKDTLTWPEIEKIGNIHENPELMEKV